MKTQEYERTQLIITEFDDSDVIATSGELNIPLDKYEVRRMIEE